jgi:hypothetical protein
MSLELRTLLQEEHVKVIKWLSTANGPKEYMILPMRDDIRTCFTKLFKVYYKCEVKIGPGFGSKRQLAIARLHQWVDLGSNLVNDTTII